MAENHIIAWNQPLGRPECPFNRRYVLNLGLFSLRLHHWLASDDLRALHDHPYWMLIFVLKGSYVDVTERGEELMTPGTIRFRRANHLHGVKITKAPCWTFLITGPPLRNWGYVVDGKWMRREKYFKKFGLHPCDPIRFDKDVDHALHDDRDGCATGTDQPPRSHDADGGRASETVSRAG